MRRVEDQKTALRGGRKLFGHWLLAVVLALIAASSSGCEVAGEEREPVRGLGATPSSERTSDPPAQERGDVPRGEEESRGSEETRSLPSPEESCDDLRVLVDRNIALPSSYVPEDLVPLAQNGVPTSQGDLFLRREATVHLRDLMVAARADGKQLVVASAYRSYADQQRTFAGFVAIYGSQADVISARPGHSQHQLGTAVDFTNATVSYELLPSFGSTSAGEWLTEHAPEYGFVLAFPNSAEQETGVQWEPWHYRYIGVKNAKRLEESAPNLQEFLEREGVRPRC